MRGIIEGNHFLKGDVYIHGSKNAILAMIPAILLTNMEVTLENKPNITDVTHMLYLLKSLGIEYQETDTSVTIFSKQIKTPVLIDETYTKLRASYYFMGVFLGRYQSSTTLFPGGCHFTSRPIDYHLLAFQELGAIYTYRDNQIIVENKHPKSADILISKRSFGQTINAILASVYMRGQTHLLHPAIEPEIIDFILFLQTLGFKVSYLEEKDIIEIIGITKIPKGKACYRVMPDRIETTTYLIMGLLSGEITIHHCRVDDIKKEMKILKRMGGRIEKIDENTLLTFRSRCKGYTIISGPYPELPTDEVPLFGALCLFSTSKTKLIDKVYQDRLNNFGEFCPLGATIEHTKQNGIVIIPHKRYQKGLLTANDLRATASFVLFSLRNEYTIIENIDYLFRGYSSMIEDIHRLGGNISIRKETNDSSLYNIV